MLPLLQQLDVQDWKCVSSENRTDLSVCVVFLYIGSVCVVSSVCLFCRNGVSGSLALAHYTMVCVCVSRTESAGIV